MSMLNHFFVAESDNSSSKSGDDGTEDCTSLFGTKFESRASSIVCAVFVKKFCMIWAKFFDCFSDKSLNWLDDDILER